VQQQQQQQQEQGTSTAPGPHPPADNNASWVVLQQEEDMEFVRYKRNTCLNARPAWRRLLDPWGSWHLFKAQAVRGRVVGRGRPCRVCHPGRICVP
jgi:hypothetical protein